MNAAIFLRYFIILLHLVPTAVYAILPLRDTIGESSRKKIGSFSLGVLVLVVILSLAGSTQNLSPKVVYAIGLPFLYALVFFISNEEPVKKLFCFLNSTMIALNAHLYGRILSAPLELSNSEKVYSAISGLVCLLCALILLIVYWKTLTVKIPYLLNSKALDLNWHFVLLAPAAITVLFYWAIPHSAAVVMTGRLRIATLAFLLLSPIAFLMVSQASWRIAVNLSENARLREENELMQVQSKRYEELRAYMNETRALRHDFRQHLLVLYEYAEKGETEKLTDYIKQFTTAFSDHKGSFSANAAVDAVASHYDKMAQAQGTHIKWLLELPETLPFKESDFISVFGNLVENALNAVEKLPEESRSVHVTARMLSEAMLGLTVKNPYEGEIVLGEDGLPESSRKGGGVGLSSVEAVVHRHNGALDINVDDGVFTVGVLLYANQE